MKKLLPALVIASAVAVSACTPASWFGGKKTEPKVSEYGAGIQIEDLSSASQAALLRQPAADLATLKLETTAPQSEAATTSGVVRYQIEGKNVTFLVTTGLEVSKTPYTVWVRGMDKDNLTQAFKLTAGKGGAWGSASVPVDRLPLEVLVTTTDSKAQVPSQTILKTLIPAPTTQPAK